MPKVSENTKHDSSAGMRGVEIILVIWNLFSEGVRNDSLALTTLVSGGDELSGENTLQLEGRGTAEEQPNVVQPKNSRTYATHTSNPLHGP